MALDEIKLDDLTWDGMVASARRRIAAASEGRWTLHAPVDPGVTLVELFAWLLEQRVYWLDQVPDALVHASLALLRERARPARAAGTVLQFLPGSVPAAVARDTAMRMGGGGADPVIFSTTADVTVLPVAAEALGLEVGAEGGAGRDRSVDLANGRVLRLFPADGSGAWVKITLPLSVAPVPSALAPMSLLFELDVAGGLQPEWDPAAPTGVAPPASLTWWYRNAPGADPVPWPAPVEDGTGGMRRSGVVRLPVPADWHPEPPAPAAPAGAAARYAVWIRTGRATFTYPPRLVRLLPNVALARHARRTIEHRLALRWLPLPGNRIALTDRFSPPDLQDHPPLEGTVSLRLKERDGQWRRWTSASTLAWAGPADRRFVVCRRTGAIYFGDGVQGRLPVLAPPAGAGDHNVTLRYRVGGGAAGHVGENRAWQPLGGAGPAAVNVVAAVGGEEAETPAQARERAAANLRRQDRAVTRADYEAVARGSARGVAVARARAAVGVHPGFPCAAVPGAVTVYVVPDAPRDDADADDVTRESAFVAAPVPDPGALAEVRRAMERARLVGSEVHVVPPRYRPVVLTVRLRADPSGAAGLRRRLADRFRTFLDPLRGGAHGAGRPFGEVLSPSVFLRVAQQEVGDAAGVEWVGIRLAGSPTGVESCKEVPIGPHDLAVLEDLHVELDPAAPNEGGLR